MSLSILQILVGPMANFAYVIGDTATARAAVVDPGWEAETLVKAASDQGWTIEQVWLTHTHFDHIGALEELCAAVPLQAVFAHEAEVGHLPTVAPPIVTIREGVTLQLGAQRVQCLHTPGHSPGGTCFLWDGHCITGDTVFVGACGRVDLPGSDPQAMFASLRRLAELPPATQIYPGHDYGDARTGTIAREREHNQFMHAALQGTQQFYARRGV